MDPVPSAAVRAANANFAVAGTLMEELVRSGVSQLCLCPGSRSAPLALAAGRCEGLRVWTHLDERSAGFFALGLARAGVGPVALVCTSGTAAANFLPAVVEASLARLPLLVLTADRPAELRGWGAPQTIDQVGLYGSHVRWFAEAPCPEPGAAALAHARALACRAAATAAGPPAGPVHLNLPFREPLAPTADGVGAGAHGAALHGRAGQAWLRRSTGRRQPAPETLSAAFEAVAAAHRGVVLCGPSDDPDLPGALAELGRAAGFPVLAEPLGQLRSGPHVGRGPLLGCGDALLRDPDFAAAQAPDLILRFGPPPTSKACQRYVDLHADAPLWLVSGSEEWADPSHRAARVVHADPVALCEALTRRLSEAAEGRPRSAWLDAWFAADARARHAIANCIEKQERLLEPQLVRELAAALPEGATLFASNSMPVREVDAFLPLSSRRLRVLANRGANGIDGIPSTALGVAAAGAGPVVLLTGDLALLHDLGGLLSARRLGLDLVVVAIQNDGGGIFEQLPVADAVPRSEFEALFALSHGSDLCAAVAGLGFETRRVADAAELRAALARALGGGAWLIEVPVDRAESRAHHRGIAEEVASALRGGAAR